MNLNLKRPIKYFLLLICVLTSGGFHQTANAAVVFGVGWGYSLGNWISGESDNPDNPFVITEGWGWVLDPPSEGIISGRITLKFDPSWTVSGIGWLGEFGANPNLAAPPVEAGTVRFESSLLQSNANPIMQSANITVDQSNGLAVFEYDWGQSGFVPTLYLNSTGHFNLAAILFSNPLEFPAANLVTPIGAGSIAPYGIVGTPNETYLLGTDSSTYMLCVDGYCGVHPVPAPPALYLFLSGLAMFGMKFKRRDCQLGI